MKSKNYLEKLIGGSNNLGFNLFSDPAVHFGLLLYILALAGGAMSWLVLPKLIMLNVNHCFSEENILQ